MALAITLIFSIIAVVFALVGFIIGYRRGVIRSAVYLGTVIIAFVLALVLAFPTAKSICALIGSAVTDLIPTDISAIAGESAEIASLIEQLPAMLISPVIFSVLFILISLFMLIEYFLISHLALKKAPRSVKGAGGAIGAIAALLCFFCLFVPAAGYGRVVNDAVSAFPQVKTAEYTQYVEPAVANPILNAVGAVGGNAIFDTLTSADVCGTRISVSQELSIACKAVSAFAPLISGGESTDTQALGVFVETAIDDMSKSTLIPALAGSIISDMAEAWQNGEAYLGIAAPEADASTEGLLNAALAFMSTTTPETFKSDMLSVKEIISAVNKYGVLESISDPNALINIVSSEGLMNDIFAIISNTPRLRPFIPAMVNLGINGLAATLDIPADEEAIYDSMTAALAVALNEVSANPDASARDQLLKEEFHEVFNQSGVGFSEEAARLVSQYMYADYSAVASDPDFDTEDTEAFVKEFLKIAFDIYPDNVSASVEGGIIFIDSKDTYTNSNAEALKELLISFIPTDAFGNPDYLILGSVTPDQIASLVSSDEFQSNKLTLEDFAIDTDAWADADSDAVYEEAQKIADGIKLFAKVAKDISELDSFDATSFISSVDMSQIGAAVDCFKSTAIMGDSADMLLQALLSSDTLASTGIMNDDTAQLIYDIMSTSDTASYENLLGTVQSAAEMIIATHSGTAAPGTSVPSGSTPSNIYETVRSSFTWLINNISPESAEITKQILSPDLLMNLGLNSDIAAKLTDAFHALIDELLAAKTSEKMDYEKEAAAITELLNFMASYDSNPTSSIFGTVLKTADEFVATVADSKIVSNLLISLAFDGGNEANDPLGFAGAISAADKQTLKAALSQYASDNGIDANDRRITAIEALFGIK